MTIVNQTFGSQTADMTKPVGLMSPRKESIAAPKQQAAPSGNYTIFQQSPRGGTDAAINPGYRDGPVAPPAMPAPAPMPAQPPRPGSQEFINPNSLKAGFVSSQEAAAARQAEAQKKIAASQATAQAKQATDAANATVSGQLTSLLSADSPYMKAARDYSNQVMNGRGLMQSSIAVGAAQEAAIRAGLPVAQQDAQSEFQRQYAGQLNSYDVAKLKQQAEISTEAAAKGQEYDLAKIAATTTAQQQLAEQGQTFDLAKINANLAASTALSAAENAQLVANNTQTQYNSASMTLNTEYGIAYRAIQEGTMTDAQKQVAIQSLDAKYTSDMNFNKALYAGLGASTIDPAPFVATATTATTATTTAANPFPAAKAAGDAAVKAAYDAGLSDADALAAYNEAYNASMAAAL